MSAALALLDERFRPIAQVWYEVCEDVGLQPIITSTKRSVQEQAKLYAAGQSGRSPYPAAYPGTSLHEWGLAFDMEVTPHSALSVIGPLWQSIGLGKWGGYFTRPKPDPIHFEASEQVKRAAGWVPGAPYEPGVEKVEPIGKLVETVVTPWWSFLVPFDPIDFINKHF